MPFDQSSHFLVGQAEDGAGIWKTLTTNDYLLLNIWVYLQLIPNNILLPILVATFLFSREAKRHPTLINVCITWILSGAFSLLLFYANQHRIPAAQVNKELCVTQTSLLYGTTPMWSIGVLMMVYHLISTLRIDKKPHTPSKAKVFFMLSAPYIVEAAFAAATVLIAIAHPERVDRNRRQLYCSLSSPYLTFARVIFTSVICLTIIILEMRLAFILWRRWRGAQRAGMSVGVGHGLVARVLLFGVFILIGMVVNIIPLLMPSSHIQDIYGACMGLIIFLIFGLQKDVLNAWCFWRRPKRRRDSAREPINVSLANLADDDGPLSKGKPWGLRSECESVSASIDKRRRQRPVFNHDDDFSPFAFPRAPPPVH